MDSATPTVTPEEEERQHLDLLQAELAKMDSIVRKRIGHCAELLREWRDQMNQIKVRVDRHRQNQDMYQLRQALMLMQCVIVEKFKKLNKFPV